MGTDTATRLKSKSNGAGPYGSRGASSPVEPYVDPATNPAVLKQQDYAELKRRIVAAGLLKKQPIYYLINSSIRLVLYIWGFALFIINAFFWSVPFNIVWLVPLIAVFTAFGGTQVGYLGHDAGHRQIFKGAHRNDVFGLGISFLLGLGRTWWVDTHNKHHVDPNDLERDPHTFLPIFAFSKDQARTKEGLLGRMIGYQSFYFFPVLLLEYVGARLATIQFLVSREMKGKVWESSAMVLHFAFYFGVLFFTLTWWHALIFIGFHQASQGLYMGSVFAPNHKGMPTFTREDNIDFFRRQVLTSRNVNGNPVADFWYGGLNYQIEHHLFPSMSRNKLREAQPIVKAFCEELSVSYAECSAFRSNVEILQFLHDVSASLRGSQTTMAA